MNTKTRFVGFIDVLSSFITMMVILGAFKILLSGIGDNYPMLLGWVDMTDGAIQQIVRALEIAGPMVIGAWTFRIVTNIWCKAQRKIEQERY